MREVVWKGIRKAALGLIAAGIMLAVGSVDVHAGALTKFTVVYITKTGTSYHLKSDCGNSDSKRTYAKTLYDILNGGQYKMCKTCAKEFGVNINDSQNLTLDMLPYELGSNVTVESLESEEGSSEGNNSGDSQNSSGSGDSSGNSSSGESSNSSSDSSSGSSDSSSGSGSDSGSSEGSGNGSGSDNSSNTEEVTTQSSDNSNSNGNNASNSNNVNSNSKSNSKTNSKNTSKSSNSKTTTSNSSKSSSGDLMTEKQRRNKFLSKTNPKRGKKPKTTARDDVIGYAYADFARFNSYNSENGLGGTPIYLQGAVKDVQPVKQIDGVYTVAVMVDDIDGYQWYLRVKCDKSKYDALKSAIRSNQATIYGTYAGYSGVTNRPMMDIERLYREDGIEVDMAEFK